MTLIPSGCVPPALTTQENWDTLRQQGHWYSHFEKKEKERTCSRTSWASNNRRLTPQRCKSTCMSPKQLKEGNCGKNIHKHLGALYGFEVWVMFTQQATGLHVNSFKQYPLLFQELKTFWFKLVFLPPRRHVTALFRGNTQQIWRGWACRPISNRRVSLFLSDENSRTPGGDECIHEIFP